ncbi:MAG: hypothetical protein K0S48_41 [Ramlibacter sp.]|jgi:hypothetical protein|nr:hypothetical protein [Ramlibacter sp.]
MKTRTAPAWSGMGPLSPTKSGKHTPLRVVTFDTPPDRICNSASTEPYIPQDRTVYRPGSVDASRPRVRGV